jgi:hypothetical protein
MKPHSLLVKLNPLLLLILVNFVLVSSKVMVSEEMKIILVRLNLTNIVYKWLENRDQNLMVLQYKLVE